MSTPLPARLFVTGTDTGVGKTVVSALLLAGRGGRYWKPVQSGAEEDSDSHTVAELSVADGLLLPRPTACARRSRRTGPPCSTACASTSPAGPAALPAGSAVVEGAGGALVPLPRACS
jgi:dethiobiotin synthetase